MDKQLPNQVLCKRVFGEKYEDHVTYTAYLEAIKAGRSVASVDADLEERVREIAKADRELHKMGIGKTRSQ